MVASVSKGVRYTSSLRRVVCVTDSALDGEMVVFQGKLMILSSPVLHNVMFRLSRIQVPMLGTSESYTCMCM